MIGTTSVDGNVYKHVYLIDSVEVTLFADQTSEVAMTISKVIARVDSHSVVVLACPCMHTFLQKMM